MMSQGSAGGDILNALFFFNADFAQTGFHFLIKRRTALLVFLEELGVLLCSMKKNKYNFQHVKVFSTMSLFLSMEKFLQIESPCLYSCLSLPPNVSQVFYPHPSDV